MVRREHARRRRRGFGIMMGTVLPYFQLLSAAVSLGVCESATQKTVAHLTTTRYEHLARRWPNSRPVGLISRKMRIKVDLRGRCWTTPLAALEGGRADAMLRVLESKAAAGEIAAEVTDLAMRVCGGAAFRKEVGVERDFRDARAAGHGADNGRALRFHRQGALRACRFWYAR